MSSKRETILAQVVTALAGTSGVSTRIYRSRQEAFTRAEMPALVVEPVNDVPERVAIGRLNSQFTFQVLTVARADAPDTSADATVVDVHSKIMSDATLRTLVVDLLPSSTDWQFDQADKPLVVVTQRFNATYQTSETSLAGV